MKIPAPAKVNLHLRILGPRPDGFHDLETLMLPLSLGDEIEVTRGSEGGVVVTCDDSAVPLGGDNLVTRAAMEFFRHTGLSSPLRIHITKRIPMGAGLGGGSSDAATTLRVMDDLFATRLGEETLRELAGTLGSDVPFFVAPAPAWCRGRGEIIEPLAVPESLELLLIKPPFGVATPWAYQTWAAFCKEPADEEQDLGWVTVRNSLERPVFDKHLVLPVMREWLLGQAEVRAAGMSGSGSTMFAVLRSDRDGIALEARALEYFGSTFWTALCSTGR
mgnify:CR=1 FL=1